MAEDIGDKTERATPKRRQEARRDGNIPRSTDLTSAVFLAGVMIVLLSLVPRLIDVWGGIMRIALSGERDRGLPSLDSLRADAMHTSYRMTLLLAIILGLCCAVAYLSNYLQVGWLVTLKPLKPKFTKFNPIQGAKKMLGLRSAMRGSLSVLKVLFVSLFVFSVLRRNLDKILALPRMEVGQAALQSGLIIRELVIWLLAALIILGIIDFIYQKWQWERDHKMSKQEIKEERKALDGDPKVRQRQRQFAEKIMGQRIAHAVPKADVVVANPEHLAIALKWDQATMSAPIVLAKGADHVALRIRQIAMKHGVPVVERRELARAMYPLVEVGQEIPSMFYAAVAALLAYVYRLTGRTAG